MTQTVRLEVSVTDFGAVGDGVTDDTQAIANALAVGDVVRFPNPASYYKVTDDGGLLPLQLREGQTLIGPGKWNLCIQGDGSDIIFKTGVNSSSEVGKITVLDMYIKNTSYTALQLHYSPEFRVERCNFESTACNTLDCELCFRSVLRDSRSVTTGTNNWAIRVMDDCNGMVIEGNTVSGGSLGNGLDVGQCTAVAIIGNTVESTTVGYGIRVGGLDAGGDGGLCSSIVISGNYLDKTGKPISVGEQFGCYGITIDSNRILHLSKDPDDCPYGMIFGRMQCSRVHNNTYYGCASAKVSVDAVDDTATYTVTLNGTAFNYPAVGGDLEADILAGLQAVIDASASYTAVVASSKVEITLDDSPVQDFSASVSATGTGDLSISMPVVFSFDNDSNNGLDFVFNDIRDNYCVNQRAFYEYSLGVSFLFRTFGYNRMQFDDFEEPTGITKEWISDTIDPSVGTGNDICIVPQNGKGGIIDMIEIIEATGTLGSTVEVGYSLDKDENTGVDPSTLSYTNGRAECPVNVIWRIRADYDLLYRVVSGAGTGSFRIRVRYRI